MKRRHYVINPGRRMRRPLYGATRFLVLVKYQGGIDREKDEDIEKIMGRGHDGSGVFLRTGIRDHSGSYRTRREAVAVGRRLLRRRFWVKVVDTNCPVPLK